MKALGKGDVLNTSECSYFCLRGLLKSHLNLDVGGNNGDFRRKWVFGRCFNLLIPLIETVPEE